MWEKLWQYNSSAVERFCRGLDGHFLAGEPLEYIRHARILQPGPYPIREARSFDFPRHSGFYMFDWSFAYAKTGAQEYLNRIKKALDYWWVKRNAQNQLKSESRSPEHEIKHYKVISLGQTLSLGVSLLETASLVEDRSPKLAATMRECGSAGVRQCLCDRLYQRPS